MTRFPLTLLSGVAILLAATGGAQAFSEVETAPAVPGTTVTEAPAELKSVSKAQTATELPALKMIDPGASASDDEGTVLSIPGIGRIGTLPKLDFGLELLYGAPEQPEMKLNETPDGITSQPQQDDIIIRGTLKHRF